MPVVVVGETAVVPPVEVILRRIEECVADVVDSLRERVGKPYRGMPPGPVLRRSEEAVVIGVPRTLISRNVAETRVWTAQVRNALCGCLGRAQRRHIYVAGKDQTQRSQ